MAKITLDTITSSFASTSLFNTNFTAIKDELNNKVLYRDNPTGEANQMLNDLDMNSNDIINAATINATGLTLNGVQVVPDGTTTLPALALSYDNTTSGLAANNVQAAIDEVEGRVDTAETQQAQGQNYGKNLIINGDFSIWQRGTSQTSSGYGSVDRFKNFATGSTQSITREEFTPGQTDVPGNSKYYFRNVVSSVAGAGNLVATEHYIENVARFSGSEVTLSFWAKADSSKNIATQFQQNFGTGGSQSLPVNELAVTTHALTTTWTKYTVTTTLPSILGKTFGTNGNDFLVLTIWLDAGSNFDSQTNSLGQQSGTFDIANVQLEFGDTATEFEYVSPADQLVRCQRYYARWESATTPVGIGSVYSTNTCYTILEFPSPMRAEPAFSISSAADFDFYQNGGVINGASMVTLTGQTTNNAEINFTATTTANQPVLIRCLAGWFAFDAEL